MSTSTSSTATCIRVASGQTYDGKQGLSYFAGISAEATGAQGICMHLVTLPPGKRANAHLHEHHETAIYVLSGASTTWYGEGLREYVTVSAGEFLYIPAGMPHLPANASDTEPCVAVLARTDPNEQESVILLPELDGIRERNTAAPIPHRRRRAPKPACTGPAVYSGQTATGGWDRDVGRFRASCTDRRTTGVGRVMLNGRSVQAPPEGTQRPGNPGDPDVRRRCEVRSVHGEVVRHEPRATPALPGGRANGGAGALWVSDALPHTLLSAGGDPTGDAMRARMGVA